MVRLVLLVARNWLTGEVLVAIWSLEQFVG